MNRMRPLFVALAIVISACSDPAGPCDRSGACEVAGIDIAITGIRVASGQMTGTDPVTNLPIYAPGPMTIEISVVNRGDSTSAPQPVTGGATIPALAPGATAKATFPVDFSGQVAIAPSWAPINAREADIVTVAANLQQRVSSSSPAEWPAADADVTNNSAELRLHVAMPVLTGELENRPALRAGEEFVSVFSVSNVSMHGGNADAFDVVLCLWDFDVGCTTAYHDFFGRFPVPGVAAGQTHQNAYAASLTLAAMPMIWRHPAALSLCTVPSDFSGTRLSPLAARCLASGGNTVVRPDYSLCNPPVITIGTMLHLTQPNCPDTRGYSVVAIDAVAGAHYVSNGTPRMLTADGERGNLPGSALIVATSGRYYLQYSHTGPLSILVHQNLASTALD